MMETGRHLAGVPFLLFLGMAVAASCAGAPNDSDETAAETIGTAQQAALTCITLQDTPNPPQDGIDDAPISTDPTDPVRANTNYGLTQQMNAGYVGTEYRRILMQFDLTAIPTDSTVTSATLSFRMIQSLGKQPINFHLITSAWTETAVTWNNFGTSFDPAPFISVPTLGVPNNSFINVDLTAQVAAWVSGATAPNGLLIDHPTAGRTAIASTEGPVAARPKLAACFLPPVCDDGIQNGGEQGVDCGGPCPTPCEFCGNGVCSAAFGEDCSTCAADCGSCCGNASCEPALGEDCVTCAADCGSCCGNGSCDAALGEDCATCTADCGSCCPHDTCTNGGPLDVALCSDPCVAAVCGVDPYCCGTAWDATCIAEVSTVCGSLACTVCGDTICDANEDCSTCPGDCGICGWTCNPAYYGGADGCDCGCGVVDPDCADSTSASCDYCNDFGSCDATLSGCPGLIDPANNGACVAAVCGDTICSPGEDCSTCAQDCGVCVWNCDPTYYGTGDGCDCGCGIVDPDCADGTSASCDYCNDVGSCDGTFSGCPGLIDPIDNATCDLPVCGDLVCGLGEDCSLCPFDCGPCGWTCDPLFYGAADGCDCGCGIQDLDCVDATTASCDWCNDLGSCDTTGGGCPGVIDAVDNAVCSAFCGDLVCDPNEDCTSCATDCGACGWNCNPTYYGTGDGCDCGCGVPDPDCGGTSSALCAYCNDFGSCDVSLQGCPGLIDPNDNAVCVAPFCGDLVCGAGEDCSSCPSDCGVCGWTCNPAYYGTADGCDCGCGIADPDCADGTAASCDWCNDFGSCDVSFQGCPGLIDPLDNTACIAPFCGDTLCSAVDGEDCSSCPEDCGACGWNCNPAYYGTNDGCDCGCGSKDPDCADGTSAACDYCNDLGSCDTTFQGCPGVIDPVDNGACASASCGDGICGSGEDCSTCQADCGICGWNCNAAYYGTNDGCDCGCGIVDPDCADSTSASCAYCNNLGSCDTTFQGCPGIIGTLDNSVCGP